VRPAQFSRQCREFWLIAISFIKLTHPPEVLGGESAGVRIAPVNIGGKRNDGGLAPTLRSNTAADVFADAPV
jgi:hypothetical protein